RLGFALPLFPPLGGACLRLLRLLARLLRLCFPVRAGLDAELALLGRTLGPRFGWFSSCARFRRDLRFALHFCLSCWPLSSGSRFRSRRDSSFVLGRR